MRRRRYASDSYDADEARRLRRIESRACPELQQAYEGGRLSLRKYDLVSRGSKAQQRRVVTAQKARDVATLIAARTIDQFLDGIGTETPIQLREVVSAIRNAVRV
jgi:hypothetical protein